MNKSVWEDCNWKQFATDALGLVLHGTGTALVVTGRALESCGDCLHGLAAHVSSEPTRQRRSAARKVRVATA